VLQRLVISALLVAAGLASVGHSSSSAPSTRAKACSKLVTSGSDADEVRRLELRGAASNVDGWSIEEARAFFAPEWVSVQPDGSQVGLDKVFSSFENGRSRPWAARFALTELDIRVYCDMAIVIGTAEASAKGDKQPPRTVHFRYLNIWRKSGAGWLYAAQQYTRF